MLQFGPVYVYCVLELHMAPARVKLRFAMRKCKAGSLTVQRSQSMTLSQLKMFEATSQVLDAERSLSAAEPSSTRNHERLSKRRAFKSDETWERRLFNESL